MKWHKFPQETPPKVEGNYGEYLVRGITNNKRLHYFVCLWVWQPNDDLRGFFYGGNEFRGYMQNESFEWINVNELNNE